MAFIGSSAGDELQGVQTRILAQGARREANSRHGETESAKRALSTVQAKASLGASTREKAKACFAYFELEVVVVMGSGLGLEEAGGLAPSGGLPVVFAFLDWDPGRQKLIEIRSERENIRFVHVTQFEEARVSGCAIMEFEAVLREDIADAAKLGRRKTIARQRTRRGAEDLREIDDGVAGDGEGEFSLTFAGAVDADHDERAGVEDRGEGRDPRLIVVLRAEVGEHRIAEMAFH